jgi:hypothetical protein
MRVHAVSIKRGGGNDGCGAGAGGEEGVGARGRRLTGEVQMLPLCSEVTMQTVQVIAALRPPVAIIATPFTLILPNSPTEPQCSSAACSRLQLITTPTQFLIPNQSLNATAACNRLQLITTPTIFSHPKSSKRSMVHKLR